VRGKRRKKRGLARFLPAKGKWGGSVGEGRGGKKGKNKKEEKKKKSASVFLRKKGHVLNLIQRRSAGSQGVVRSV